LALLSGSRAAFAQKKYDNGASDTEIKLGHCGPYSGPASAYGVIGKGIEAYWKSVNDAGGINGRKVNFVTLDDGYSPAKTVEVVRQLVEQDKVLCLFNTLGTPSNTAIQKYMNQKKVPQLYVATGASKWGRPKEFPWTMGYQPDYHTEAVIYAKHILTNIKDAKVGVLMQNDDFGKDYVDGFKEGLGKDAGNVIAKLVTYEVTDPTVESQIIQLKDSGANVFFNVATPKFAAQAIRKTYDIGWTPVRYMTDVSQSISSVMKPAGLEKSKGVITAIYGKDPTDARWKDDPGYKAFAEFVGKYMTPKELTDANAVYGFGAAATMVQVLKQCGNDLSRENVMRQAANLKDFVLQMGLPGIKINTSPDNFSPIRQEALASFNGESWEQFGELYQA
jgi:branched-chain amino acid transport system substrate-binding protein